MQDSLNLFRSFTMSETEIAKILNQLSETEIKEENWCNKARDNLNKLWNRDNEILQERLIKVEKEMMTQIMLKNKVQNLEKEILDLTGRKEISRAEICELKCVLNETDNEIRSQQIEEKKLKQRCESRKVELGKLEKVKNLLTTQQSLYDNCLNTRLCCETSDIFKLSFMDDEKCIGWIKFSYRGDENHFEVTEVDPKDLVSDFILNKFHETQDTQGLLCSIRQNLPKN